MGYWFFKNSISNTKFAMPGLGQGFCWFVRATVRVTKPARHRERSGEAGGPVSVTFKVTWKHEDQ